jgi:hypothetical protein
MTKAATIWLRDPSGQDHHVEVGSATHERLAAAGAIEIEGPEDPSRPDGSLEAQVEPIRVVDDDGRVVAADPTTVVIKASDPASRTARHEHQREPAPPVEPSP